jgi:hypothetical protein
VAPKDQQEPEFQPRKALDALTSMVESLGNLLRSLRDLWEILKGLKGSERKAVGAGVFGAFGAAGTVAAGVSQAAQLPFWAYCVIGFAFQVFWIRYAVPMVVAESDRRKTLYDGRRDEDLLQDRFKKTREWRRLWASSLAGRLKTPLESSPDVENALIKTVEKVAGLTGYSMALVLVRKMRGGRYEIVLTVGEVSDCLKRGTAWRHREMDVYEYIARRSLYPNHLIERESVGDSEYFLVAAAEIDVIGKIKGEVLDCFVEVVGYGIGRVVADGDA